MSSIPHASELSGVWAKAHLARERRERAARETAASKEREEVVKSAEEILSSLGELRKRWFRWRPAFTVTDDMLIWAGTLARARSLMDLKSVEDAIAGAKP